MVSNLLSLDRNYSTKIIIDDTKLANLDNEINKITVSKDLIRKEKQKKTIRKKTRKKSKKGKKNRTFWDWSYIINRSKSSSKKKRKKKKKL